MKILGLWFGFITVLVLSMGCDTSETGPTNITSDNPFERIELRLTHPNGYNARYRGEQYILHLTAIVRNADGVADPGAKIQFSILDPEEWKGTITPLEDDSATNHDGEITAIYTVVLERSGGVEIEARCGNVTTTFTIYLEVYNDIGQFTLDAASVLTVRPNQTSQTPVTATLVDTSGNAVPGVLIHFRVGTSALGYFDSDTGMTDANGMVERTFNTIAGNFGPCTLYARFGSTEDSTLIEIIPIANPRNIWIYTPTPGPFRGYPGQNVQIEIWVVLTDEHGVGVPVNFDITFEIIPYLPGGEIFGSLDPIVSNNGRTTFSSQGGLGKVWIRAWFLDYDENVVADSVLLNVELIQDQIGELILSIEPDSLFLHRDSVGVANIIARVVDQENNGLANIRVDLNCRYGSIANVTLTDSAGCARAEYYILPLTDFPDGATEVTDTIVASIPGTAFESQAQIYVAVLTE